MYDYVRYCIRRINCLSSYPKAYKQVNKTVVPWTKQSVFEWRWTWLKYRSFVANSSVCLCLCACVRARACVCVCVCMLTQPQLIRCHWFWTILRRFYWKKSYLPYLIVIIHESEILSGIWPNFRLSYFPCTLFCLSMEITALEIDN